MVLIFISVFFLRVGLSCGYRLHQRLEIRIDNERVTNLFEMIFKRYVGPLLWQNYLYSFVLSTRLSMGVQQLLTTERVQASKAEELLRLVFIYL